MTRLSRPLTSLALSLALVFGATEIAQAQATKTQAISLYNLGLSAFKQGSPESAIIFFKRAADIDPDLADAQYNLGVLYQSEKRLKEAVPRYQEVLRIKPGDADAHYQLGLAYLDLGRSQEAREQFLTIAPNSPHFADSQKRLAQINQPGVNDLDRAVNPVNPPTESLSSNPNQGTYRPNDQTNGPTVVSPIDEATKPPARALDSTPALPAANLVPLMPNSTASVYASGFSAPAGLAFDKQGNLYIANFLSNTIERITTTGARSQFASGINLKGPIGLVVDDSGSLFVANYLGGFISRIDPAGISSIVAKGFRKPYYLALASDGSLFVSQQEDNTIVRINLPRSVTTRAQLPR
jgi:tetratricopeptide (TPR) repeat protein